MAKTFAELLKGLVGEMVNFDVSTQGAINGILLSSDEEVATLQVKFKYRNPNKPGSPLQYRLCEMHLRVSSILSLSLHPFAKEMKEEFEILEKEAKAALQKESMKSV